MILPKVQFGQVESLGRANIGATGRVGAALNAKSKAETAIINNLAKVGGEFIRREEEAKFNQTLSQTNISESQFVEKEGVR